ncbi:hypothetical protein MATL_G00198390 [Megalops atlanticus]|uniref:PHD-type domain-containing protein n=1 Tax=Megalops atlanticus TaxID=7932 RepID=A0A9D3PNR2_MEGAT|nr:hypothetical protein MATL_G00198390 [Megalops atlanticus]
MKKFGGPGRLKQTCILRQCLAPGLPLSAVCGVCGEGNQDPDETPVFSLTLMECSNCAQIVHPDCIKVSGEGVVNKDLPSCWECPKCTLEKAANSESSGSEDDDDNSAASVGSVSPSAPPSEKRPHSEGVGAGEGEGEGDEGGGGRLPRRGRLPLPLSSLSQARSRRVAPPPSHRLLLQQQQNRKRAGALELRLGKRMKMERDKILPSKRKSSSLDSHSPKLLRSRSQDRDGGDSAGDRKMPPHLRGSPRAPSSLSAERLLRGSGGGRRGLWRGSAHRTGQGGRLMPNSPLGMRRRLGVRERGRGVRLRGVARPQRGREGAEEEEKDSADSEEEEEEMGDAQRGGRLDKENRPHRRKGRVREEEEEEESEGREQDGGDAGEEDEDEEEDEDGEEDGGANSAADPVLLVSDLSEDRLNGSYVTVKLQRPPKAKRDPGSIVPKLEAAVAPRPPGGQGYVQRKSLQRPQPKNGRGGAEAVRSAGPGGGADPASSRRHPRLHPHGLSQPRQLAEACVMVSRVDGKREAGSSCTSAPPAAAPPSVLSLASLRDAGGGPACEKEVWVSVFRYLTRAELCVCMTVCKSWYKWSCDKRLWTRIDLSRCRSISPQALSGIIKRQPVSLDLSWTPITKKQLTWLINRLPGLKDLIVSGCSWSSVSALSSPSCPLLRTLDLRWTEGVKDTQIRDLLTPPGCDNRSKLRNMLSFRLAGLEISDSTLRLIIRHMPLLARLDLSHCRGVTDQSVNLLTAVGSSTRNTLTEINLAGCSKLTDTCLTYLKRVSSLTLLDLRGCKHVTRQACESFIAELSVNALYCLSEDKLIQRIS